MDPLSITASIVALLQITSSAISYTVDVKKASEEQTRFAAEAASIFGLLTILRLRVQSVKQEDPWFRQISQLAGTGGILDQLRSVLERVVSKTRPSKSKTARLTKSLTWSFDKKDVEDALTHIERLKTTLNIVLQDSHFSVSLSTRDDVRELKTDQDNTKRQERQREITAWLRAPDVSLDFHEALRKRQSGTGTWFTTSKVASHWETNPCFVLLYGKAGCGKTVISSTILESILSRFGDDPSFATAYFYFNFNDTDKRTSTVLLCTLVAQLAPQTNIGLEVLEQAFLECDNGMRRPRDEVLAMLLDAMIEDGQETFIVIDAIDECQDGEELLLHLQSLVEKHSDVLHLLITTRPEVEVMQVLTPYAVSSIDMQSAVVDNDISLYIQNRLKTDIRLRKWPDDIHVEVQTELMRRSDGMFRWAHCQLEALRSCIRPTALRQTLLSLPRSLDETYERVLASINKQGRSDDAFRILRWLCYAREPLRTSQLVEILATTTGPDGQFTIEDRLTDPQDITSICSTLIEDTFGRELRETENIRTGSQPGLGDEVRLAHYSVAEYILSGRSFYSSQFDRQDAEAELAEICLHYLFHLCFDCALDQTPGIFDEYPLTKYAVQNWWVHMNSIEKSAMPQSLLDLAYKLLTNNSANLPIIMNDLTRTLDLRSRQSKATRPSPVYWASRYGLAEVVRMLCQNGYDSNSPNEYGGFPLVTAATHGFDHVVDILLQHGTVTSICGDEALREASARGFTVIVQRLLAHGTQYHLPLWHAVREGHDDIVKILLDAGASLDDIDGGRSCLWTAVKKGYSHILSLLLARGADDYGPAGFWGALNEACRHGHVDVVKILIGGSANGVENETRGRDIEYSPLVTAAAGSHLSVVQLLLASTLTNVNHVDLHYGTALQQACLHAENEEIVDSLLEKGADPNLSGGDWRLGSPLSVAIIESGNERMVRKLVNAGADPNLRGPGGRVLLCQAVNLGFEPQVRTLLRFGVDVDLIDESFGTALQLACAIGDSKLVALLLEHEADPDISTGVGVPLWESCAEFDTIRELVLEKSRFASLEQLRENDNRKEEQETAEEGLILFTKKKTQDT